MERSLIIELARIYSETKPEKENSPNVHIRCPASALHAKDGKSPTLSVEVRDGEPSRAHCFVCELGGSLLHVFTIARDRVGLWDPALNRAAAPTLDAAIAFIEEHDKGGFLASLEAARAERLQQPRGKQPFYMTPAQLAFYVARCKRQVPQYLIERGFLRGDVEKWGLGCDLERESYLTNRATFPIYDESKTLVGITGRALPTWDPVQGKFVEENPKYKDWPPAFAQKKVETFYGEQFVDPTLEEVVLVEGPPATIFAARVLKNVLGLFGANTGIGPIRFAKLRRWAKRLVFMLDGDKAGREAVEGKLDDWNKWHPGLREQLQRWFVCEVAVLPEGKDPADLTSGAVLEARRNAVYLFDFRRI